MLQDIAPQVYHNEFYIKKPQNHDYFFYIKDGQILLDATSDHFPFPSFEEYALNRPDIATRPLAGAPSMLSTYLVRRGGEPSEPLKRFISRVKRLNASTPDEGGA